MDILSFSNLLTQPFIPEYPKKKNKKKKRRQNRDKHYKTVSSCKLLTITPGHCTIREEKKKEKEKKGGED